MKINTHILFVWALISMVLLTACTHDLDMDVNPSGPDGEGNVQIEIFTRAQNAQLPTTRGGANQTDVDMTPYVLVFEINGSVATCVEAVRAFELSGINKRYVTLTSRPTGTYRFLILANNEKAGVGGQQFWFDGTRYEWTEENIQATCVGRELTDISNLMLTDKLMTPKQTELPYINGEWSYLIPMTYLTDPVTGISSSTKIGQPEGVGSGPLELVRSLARISITNNPDRNWEDGGNGAPYNNFKMTGIMSIGNTPTQAKVYNYEGTHLSSVTLTEIARDNYASSICEIGQGWDQYVQVHWGDLVLVNETAAGNNTYFIIEGIYTTPDGVGTRYYYKMAALDNNQNPLELKRNHLYEFTITNVRGPGYLTAQEAIASPAANSTVLQLDITTIDLSSHHVITNGNYYLGVSNSHYVAYTDVPQEPHVAFSIITDYFSRTGLNPTPRNTIIPTSGISCNVSSISNTTNATQPLNVTVTFQSGTRSGSVEIWLGNLTLTVGVEYRSIIPGTGARLFYYQYYKDSGTEKWNYTHYAVSGTVDSGAASWIKMAAGSINPPQDLSASGPYYDPDQAILTDVTDHVTSDHGKIQIYIDENRGAIRSGIFYLSTGYNPEAVSSEYKVKRIKFDIKQAVNN